MEAMLEWDVNNGKPHASSYIIIHFQQLLLGAQCSENSIQLIGELSQNAGVVAICLGGSWGKVCGELESSDDHAATVICRQLGFSIVGKTMYYVYVS